MKVAGANNSSVVVVTGLSGAGKSTVLNALEDVDFYCVDNLPSSVIDSTLKACWAEGVKRVALGIDVRVGSFLESAIPVIDASARDREHALSILFLDASDESLLRRFSSTRRPHPLGKATEAGGASSSNAVLNGIRTERERLVELKARATHVVVTSSLNVHELRGRVLGIFGPGQDGQQGLRVRFVSFGFKYGPPVDADVLLDVRFLANPYFVEELRQLSGLDAGVRDYVLGSPDGEGFRAHAHSLLGYCLPRFEKEGKSYLTVGIGCTGGRHRSVALSERLAADLAEETGMDIDVVHRDLSRDPKNAVGPAMGPPSSRRIR